MAMPATTFPSSTDRARPIGRDEDAARVGALLADPAVGLVTLTGPGGVGKTTLARHVGAELGSSFADGVTFVDLAVLVGPAELASHIAQAVGLPEATHQAPEAHLAEHFRDRHALLVLDNFEHLLDAADVVAGLVAACPALRVLVTTREALHLRGEQRYPLAPLALPGPELLADLPALARVAGVDLFVRRAQAVVPDFTLGPENAADVIDIVTRLDGLPLALELAAARVRLFRPAEFRARLDASPLGLLSGGARDLPARQQTIQATIAWSYYLLEPDEQRLFQCLGVFANGFSVEAVEDVASAVLSAPVPDVVAGLESLVDKSLVVRLPHDGSSRLGLLEMVRVFALAELSASGSEPAARRAHLTHYLALARTAAPQYRKADAALWLARMTAAEDNLRMALGWALDDAQDPERAELGIHLVAWASRLWTYAGRTREGMGWVERALPLAESLSIPVVGPADTAGRDRLAMLARFWHAAGTMIWFRGDSRRAASLFARSLEIFTAAGHEKGMAMARHDLASRLGAIGQPEAALALLEENVRFYEGQGQGNLVANTLGLIGLIHLQRFDYAAAGEVLERALDGARRGSDDYLVAITLGNLGQAEMGLGHLDRAEARLQEAVAAGRASFPTLISDPLNSLGRLRHAQGNAPEALRFAQAALRVAREAGNRSDVADSLVQAGFARQLLGDAEPAAELLGAGEALHERCVGEARKDPYYLAGLDLLRAALSEARFEAAQAAGRALPLDAAVALALADPLGVGSANRGSGARPPATPSRPADPLAELTRREREVALLMARGQTNDEIATALVISLKTVEMHASHVLQKLEFRNRVQLAAWAAAEGLIS
jgi:non-specific serine/threonine protein kinase